MTSPFDIAGLRIWITGGGGGIGAAIARQAAGLGARIAVTDLDAAAAAAVASGLAGEGHDSRGLDVTDARAVAAFVRDAGPPDALIHCAGTGMEARLDATDPEDLERIFRVNVTGTLLCARAAMQDMAPGGSIVTFASTAGHAGSVRRGAYAASKAAVISLTRTLAAEAAARGIRANVVSPGPVRTPLVDRMHGPRTKAAFAARVPLGRYAEPREIAGAALFLIGPAAGFVTGHVLTVDGGFTAVPMMIPEEEEDGPA
jgi:NAD(P)-dependent dehydrogenase (short-subunit alcohol dehydrogenase family)